MPTAGIFILTAILVQSLPAPVQPPSSATQLSPYPAEGSWRPVVVDSRGAMGRSVAFVETASVVRDGDIVSFRAEVRIERPRAGADTAVLRFRAACASRRFEQLDGVYYGGGQPMAPAPPTPMRAATPGTNIYVMIDGVCADRYLGPPVDRSAYARRVYEMR